MKYKKNLFLLFTFFATMWSNFAFCQDFYPRNFNDLYAVNKTEKDSFIGIINERYLKLKDFYPINDSVFTTKNKEEFLIFHFKLNNPKIQEVTIEYLLENPVKINHFLERIRDEAPKDFAKNNSFFLEEQSSDKRQYVSLSVEKNKIFQDKKFNKIKFTFKENLIESNEKSYKWRQSKHQLSRAYPLQNSIWYFDTKTATEEKVDDWGNNRITTTIYCSKAPKYPHKIEFLDDRYYIVTYNKDKEPKILTGKYRTNSGEIYGEGNQLIDIDFNIDIAFREEETTTAEVVETSKTSEPLKVSENIKYNKVTDLEIGSWEYLYEIFRYSYELNLTENKDIMLTHIELNGGIYPDVAPSTDPKKNKK